MPRRYQTPASSTATTGTKNTARTNGHGMWNTRSSHVAKSARACANRRNSSGALSKFLPPHPPRLVETNIRLRILQKGSESRNDTALC